MRRFILIVAAVLMALGWPREASPQVSTTPVQLVKPFSIDRGYAALKTLTDLYNTGEWTKLQDLAKELLRATKASATTEHPGHAELENAVDPSKHYIIVTWIGTDVFDKPMLARVIVHGPQRKAEPQTNDEDLAEPFLADLPGVGVRGNEAVYEVFFSRGTRGKIADVYTSTRDKNPISEELPAFIQAIAAPLFGTFGILAGPIDPPPAPRGAHAASQPSIAATVSHVALPFERATIKWKALAKEPISESDFNKKLKDLSVDLKFSEVAHSKCGQEFVDNVLEKLAEAVTDPRCSADAPTSTAASCKAFIGTELATTYDHQECGASSARKPPTKEEKDELLSIDGKVRKFATDGLTMSAERDLTFKNRPVTHWSFGAGSSVITSASLTLPRVNVKGDKIVADPLPRVMTMSFVNWSPAGYDADRDYVSRAERVRPFFGATLTPDFGIAAGLNVLLARGIGVITGGALMFAKGAAAEQIDRTPANPEKPYAISYARGLFLGISYNFK